MKMITPLIEPSSGEILFDGAPIQRDLIAYKQRIGYVPEEPHLYGHLSGLEYLGMVGQLRNLAPKPTDVRIDGRGWHRGLRLAACRIPDRLLERRTLSNRNHDAGRRSVRRV